MSVPKPHASTLPAAGLSIFVKLSILILSLLAGSVGILAFYLPARQIDEMRAELNGKASTYGRLVAKQVESAVAFDDQQTAREIFDSIAQDPDIEALTLYAADGAVLHARGVTSQELYEKGRGVTSAQIVGLQDRVAAIVPVVSLEGPRGVLVLEVTTRRLAESRSAVLLRAGAAGLVALFVGALGAYFVARSLARRLAAIATVADRVAAGDLNQGPVVEGGARDEIGRLAVAVNAMLGQIRGFVAQIRDSAQKEHERLEGLVRVRTTELHARNDEMRRVLDNVGQGFFSLDATGHMSRERSAIVEKWFGSPPEDSSFAKYLSRFAPEVGQWFELGWEAVTDDVLPREVALSQLPKQFQVGEQHFELDYRPITLDDGALERVLVVVSDVTAQKERERAEAGEREMTRLFSRMVSDRAGFLEFFAEVHQLLNDISSPGVSLANLKRALHTLKGNAAIYGLDSLAATCHHLEDVLQERGTLTAQELSIVEQRWVELSTKVRTIVSDAGGRVEIHDKEYEEILDMVERGVPREQIRQLILAWRLESTETRLGRIAEQAKALATRLEKGPIEVRIEHNELKLNPQVLGEFWTAAVHVVRNAVDHGLESPEERAEAGKVEAPALALRAKLTSDRFVVEFADNGRGIDWQRVAEHARRRGLPAETQVDLCAALFVEGFSTREAASETSGRGVGLGVVHAACRKMGGEVEIESELGKGTTFRFVWPAHVVTARSRRSIVSPSPRSIPARSHRPSHPPQA